MTPQIALKVKNYKSFSTAEQGFERIKKLNIIIGKNNSGKTSLLDLIEYSFNPEGMDLVGETYKGIAVAEKIITDELLMQIAEHNSKNSMNQSHLKRLREMVGGNLNKTYKMEIRRNAPNIVTSSPVDFVGYQPNFTSAISSEISERTVTRITAERDMTPENFESGETFEKNGKGATQLIWKYLTVIGFNQNYIKKDFLKAINEIINPDIVFTDIIIKEEIINGNRREISKGEIYFEDGGNTWIALSKMGSGIKSIILVLIHLILLPKHLGVDPSKMIFCFEELENNLHPSLQRRLFNFIIRYSQNNSCLFFITTHSSIVINLFSRSEDSQIIHVEKIDGVSYCKTISEQNHNISILRDLDNKASDLLLANGVIWVEGPSDAIYIEIFLDLLNSVNRDSSNLNYSIQSLATSIWKYAGFGDFKWADVDETTENRIISLAKINHNHIIIIDGDNNYEDLPPSQFNNFKLGTGRLKARLISESLAYTGETESELETNFGDSKNGTLSFWVNDGTIETYLDHFLTNRGKDFKQFFAKNETGGYTEKKRTGENSSISKVELAANIAKFIRDESIKIDDIAPTGSPLLNKLTRLRAKIASWNE